MRLMLLFLILVGSMTLAKSARADDNYMEQYDIHDVRHLWTGHIKNITPVGQIDWSGLWENCETNGNCSPHRIRFRLEGSKLTLQEVDTNQFYEGGFKLVGADHYFFELKGIFGNERFIASGNVVLP
jgi:hypothetical protein